VKTHDNSDTNNEEKNRHLKIQKNLWLRISLF